MERGPVTISALIRAEYDSQRVQEFRDISVPKKSEPTAKDTAPRRWNLTLALRIVSVFHVVLHVAAAIQLLQPSGDLTSQQLLTFVSSHQKRNMSLYTPLPYASVCADRVYPPSPVRPSPEPPPPLPRYRINLLATDGVHLYHPLSRNHLAKYIISRPHTPIPTPLPSIPITPPTTINNIRVSAFPSPKSPTLIMTGGHELSLSPGTLTLHTPGAPAARTQNLPLRSAWGLATHPSGAVALTTNSCSGLVLTLNASELHTLSHIANLRAHENNIPCVHFSPCGKFLASASIDFTYAIFHAATGRRLFQSGEPITAPLPKRTIEWCWAVHWLPGTIAVPVSEEDPVWVALSEQRRAATWEPPDGYAFVPAARASLFDPPNPVSSRPHWLYQDYSPVEGPREFLYMSDSSSIDFDPSDIVKNPYCFAVPKSSFHPGPMKEEPEEKEENEYLMLVCREESIFLCRVKTSLQSGEEENPSVTVDTLDALRIRISSGNRQQVMYTNIIEVPKLNLVIITGVNTGVILLRILQPIPGTKFELLQKDGNYVSTDPLLFVERVITPPNESIIGTCVVERPSDNTATESFELWILTQDGMIQCWDLSRGELALDISARF